MFHKVLSLFFLSVHTHGRQLEKQFYNKTINTCTALHYKLLLFQLTVHTKVLNNAASTSDDGSTGSLAAHEYLPLRPEHGLDH